jgi:hypothetical protein
MSTNKLKIKLLKEKAKKHQCENCGLESWQGGKIPIELHHIDGNPKNNDINNLQILCPNCHALTNNYRGRNKKRIQKGKFITDDEIALVITECYNRRQVLLFLGMTGYGASYERINKVIQERGVVFKEGALRDRSTKYIKSINEKYGSLKEVFKKKVNWPTKEQLEEMLKNESAVQIGKKLGVSDNAVRKAAKRYGIDIRSISKWSKKHGS